MLKKQDYHHHFLENISMNISFMQREQKSIDCKEVTREEVNKSKMIPQNRLDVTIQEITFAMTTPFINEKRQQTNAVKNKQGDNNWKARRIRQVHCQHEWVDLHQFYQRKERELKYFKRKEQLRKEKREQSRREKQELLIKEKPQEKKLKQPKLNITDPKQKYKKMKTSQSKASIQSTNSQKSTKLVTNSYIDQKLQHKRQNKEILNIKKVTLSETQELILGLAVYLGILQTSFIQSCLQISQKEAKQYFLENTYRIMLLSRDLLTNCKKKLTFIYNQPNKHLIELFQLCMQKNGLTIEDITEDSDETHEFSPLRNPISFPTFKDQIRQCNKK